MYVLLRSEEGARFRLRPGIELVILEIGEHSMKLGLVESLRQPAESTRGPSLVESVSQGTKRSHQRGYYRFLHGGQRMFVLTRQEGECLWNDDFQELVLLELQGRSAVLGSRQLSPGSHKRNPAPAFAGSSPQAAVPQAALA